MTTSTNPNNNPPVPAIFTPSTQTLTSPHQSYQLTNYLGGGSAGLVYEAQQLNNNPPTSSSPSSKVAIKILTPIPYRLYSSHHLQQFYKSAIKSTTSLPDNPLLLPPSTSNQQTYYTLHHPITQEILYVTPLDLDSPNTTSTTIRELNLIELSPLFSQQHPTSTTILPTKFLHLSSLRNKILLEIHHMQICNGHPNVLSLLDVFEHIESNKLTIFLILELATGGELFDRIQLDMGLEEPIARRYFSQLLNGIQHCHSLGISHCDIKPENLLLCESSETILKIADFGFSQQLKGNSDLTQITTLVGSPHYQAPELLLMNTSNCSHYYDAKKADSWSCGVVLFAMLAGKLPFSRDLITCPMFHKWKKISTSLNLSNESSFLLVGVEDLDDVDFSLDFFPEHLSNEVVELIAGLLDPNPNTRFSIQQAQSHSWFKTTNKNLGQMTSTTTTTTTTTSSLPIPSSGNTHIPSSISTSLSTSTKSLSFQSPPLVPLNYLMTTTTTTNEEDEEFYSLIPQEFNTTVHRSTRFTITQVPPQEILNLVQGELNHIHNIPNLDSKFGDPFTLIIFHKDDLVEICIVKIYLMRNELVSTATYLVEFIRSSETSIFEFKRLFVDVRKKLAQFVKSSDYYYV
jgi:serine/threonine protein kinase